MAVYLLKITPAHKAADKCIRKFLKYFKKGYRDPKYFGWEREYKWEAHLQFQYELNKENFSQLLEQKKYKQIAQTAVRIESRTNLLFSFEKMALRDAVKSVAGAKIFANGLYDYLYGTTMMEERFRNFADRVGNLPRKQTRVLTWPLVTVFGFIGDPKEHIFLKPQVTKRAAEKYEFDFKYFSKPNWETYKSLLEFASRIKKDTKNLGPKDNIDLQSFIWVMGSEEYP